MIATVILGVVAVITALKLREIGKEPVAPTAPEKPRAVESPPPSPEAEVNPDCILAFNVEVEESPSPSPAVSPSPSPSPTPSPSPSPEVSPVPSPSPTPVPELPEAGIISPTIFVGVVGVLLVVLGILL